MNLLSTKRGNRINMSVIEFSMDEQHALLSFENKPFCSFQSHERGTATLLIAMRVPYTFYVKRDGAFFSCES